MRTKKLLLIAAVAVMLVGATSAYGYYEQWNGWFNSGYLEYYGDRYDYEYGSGILDDNTSGSVDTFLVTIVTPGTFTCATTGYYIMLWPHTASGWKYTGQRGQKEAYDGAWRGHAKLYDYQNELIDTFTVWGTWNTGTSIDDMYFDYTDYPEEDATYSAEWIASYSSPLGITGKGGSAGTLLE